MWRLSLLSSKAPLAERRIPCGDGRHIRLRQQIAPQFTARQRRSAAPGEQTWKPRVLALSLPRHGFTSRPSAILKSGPMLELLGFISYVITLYVYIIIAGAVMSWLMAFNVINPYNQFVRSLWQGLNALTEPALRPIRRLLPDLGGIDISPLVLILICFFIQSVILPNIAKLVA
jgi:YggT family protein